MAYPSRVSLARFLILSFLLVSSVAHADETRSACVESYESGQQHRKSGSLLAARAAFATCSQPACPDLARRDCVVWLRELESSIPSIVVRARNEVNEDVPVHAAFIDDQGIEVARGTPIDVDPGEHRVRLVFEDGRSVEQRIVMSLGEKNRAVQLVVPREAPMAQAAQPPRAAEHTRGAEERASSPVPWIVGGLGVAAMGTGVALDLVGTSELDHLRETCAPYCDDADLSAARTKIIAGDALLVVGIAVGAGLAWWLLSRPSEPSAVLRSLPSGKLRF